MGFVDVDGNITIANALPPYFVCVYCIVSIEQFIEFPNLISILACGCFLWSWRLTLVRGVLFPLSAEYSVVMLGALREPL